MKHSHAKSLDNHLQSEETFNDQHFVLLVLFMYVYMYEQRLIGQVAFMIYYYIIKFGEFECIWHRKNVLSVHITVHVHLNCQMFLKFLSYLKIRLCKYSCHNRIYQFYLVYILHAVLTPLFLPLVWSAIVAGFFSDDSLYCAMLSCTLPCSNHVATADLEPIHHVPNLKLRGHPG